MNALQQFDVVDVWAHILPQPYFEHVEALVGLGGNARLAGYHGWLHEFPALFDLDERWRAIEGLDGYRQILSLGIPPVEELGDRAAQLARLGNDEMAELVRSRPDRFLGFAAGLPLNDVDASVAELERAVAELGAVGAQLYAPVSGRPLDDPRFEPLFETLAALNVAVWLHPTRGKAEKGDYHTEDASQFGIWFALGWPWESSVAMARLVFSGIVSRYPDLPIITHHGGGFVPHFPDRLVALWEELDAFSPVPREERIPQLRKFYADTVMGPDAALRSSIDFFGIGNMLFATDMPFGPPTLVRDKIVQVDGLDLSEDDARKVFGENARRLLGLS